MDEQDWKDEFKVKYTEFSGDAKEAARGWTCCAVGCRITEEKPDLDLHNISMNKLLTPRAYRLGQKFYDYVNDNNVGKAEKCFNQIQDLDNIFRVDGKIYYPWDAYI